MFKWSTVLGAVVLTTCVGVPAWADSFSGDLFTTNLMGNRIAHVRYGFDSATGGFGVGVPHSIAMNGGHDRERAGGVRGDALTGLPDTTTLSAHYGLPPRSSDATSPTRHEPRGVDAMASSEICSWDSSDDAGVESNPRAVDEKAENTFGEEDDDGFDLGWLFGGGDGPGEYAGGGFNGGFFSTSLVQGQSGSTPPPSPQGPTFGDYVDVLGTIGQRQFGSLEQWPNSAFTEGGSEDASDDGGTDSGSHGDSPGVGSSDSTPPLESPSDGTLPGGFEPDVPEGQGPTLNTRTITYVDYAASHDTDDSGDGDQGDPKEGFAGLSNEGRGDGSDGPSTPVPEPASMVLLGTGLLILARYRRWRIANVS